jgi:hypothetical protein
MQKPTNFLPWMLLAGILFSLTQLACGQRHVAWDEHPNYDAYTQLSVNADNDCSVIALAIAADIPYHRSYNLHKDFLGRECAQCPTQVALFFKGIDDALRDVYRTAFVVVNFNDSYHPTVWQLAGSEAAKGEFLYVAVNGHALAIVNGVVFDNRVDPCLNCRVEGAFAIRRAQLCD